MEASKFTKTATVKYLSNTAGHIEVRGRQVISCDDHYSSDAERCQELNYIDADLNQQGLQLVFEHRQQLGPDVQTVRFYVEIL